MVPWEGIDEEVSLVKSQFFNLLENVYFKLLGGFRKRGKISVFAIDSRVSLNILKVQEKI